MWMRPDLSKSIVTKRIHEKIEFFEISECGEVIQAHVLSWLIIWSLNNGKNLKYQVNGGWNKIGSPEFLNASI